ncbi:hypothetical protein [Mongoliibacter ruber]|uniref:Uncharacterized protein n=1 Tax=Mongoliibacter ruber TaxID=1750599 RepID=A0A2T0WVI3_9BACT|nr:hypothetical protein [Mongoliibacter ruber]PRY90594.1 hypothetical protein CLW00_101258 [Mongoliibacter ruber]
MAKYFRSDSQRKTYKLEMSISGKALLYFVSVTAQNDGSFLHARGCDVFKHESTALEIMETIAVPATEDDYLTALKDYFAIDKKVREAFIKTYNL